MSRSSKLASLLLAIASLVPLALPGTAAATATATVEGADRLTISSNAADQITLSVVGAKLALGNVPTTLDAGPTVQIVVNAGDGVDTVEATSLGQNDYGTLTVNGGEGNDSLNGGARVDLLNGDAGNDGLTGGGGDFLNGGDGSDQIFLSNGGDHVRGGAGDDFVFVTGNDTAETYTYGPGAEPGLVLVARLAGAQGGGAFSSDIEADRMALNTQDGADRLMPIGPGLAGRVEISVNAGDGNDSIIGGDGDDLVNAGAGNDEVDGGAGNDRLDPGPGVDVVKGGDGSDLFQVIDGSDSDTFSGEAGSDSARVEGNDTAETYIYGPGPQPGHVILTRTGQGGFNLDLEAETLTVATRDGDDQLSPTGPLAGRTRIVVNAGAGDDTVIGGDGDDGLSGEGGEDILEGGAGNDSLIGGPGVDTVNGGEGDDSMTWRDGDGDEAFTGGNGNDSASASGDDTAETYTYGPGPQPGHVILTRTGQGGFNLDLEAEGLTVNSRGGDDQLSPTGPGLAGRARLQVNAGGGNDTVVGGDGVDNQNGELGNDTLIGGKGDDTANGGDGDDRMIWNNGDGTDVDSGDAGDDTVESNGNDNAEVYTYGPNGPCARARLTRAPNAQSQGGFSIDLEAEHLLVNSLGGDDQLSPTARGLAGRTELVVNAGDGADTVTGGDGRDTLAGGAGDDQLLARDGAADVVHGDAGIDGAQTDAIDTVDGVEELDIPDPPVKVPPVEQPGEKPLERPVDKPVATPDKTATLPLLGRASVAKAGGKLFAKLPLSCPASEAGGCKVGLTLRTAGKVKVGATRKLLVLGSGGAALAPDASTTVKVALKPVAATVAKGGKLPVKVSITSSDNAGNTASSTAALVLRVSTLR